MREIGERSSIASPGIGQKPTLLVSMIRNEEKNIVTMLDSVLTQGVVTHVLLCDTGSVDRTVSRAKRFLNDKNVKHHHVAQFSWDNDFASGRNKCLQKAHWFLRHGQWKVEWLLLLDADHTISINREKLNVEPQYQMNTIEIVEPGYTRNELPYVLHSTALGGDCAYRCKTHEYLHCEHGTRGAYKGLQVIHSSKGKSSTSLLRDARILKHALSNMTGDLCPVSRYHFYYAFTLFNLGNMSDAVEMHLQRQLDHPSGWYQERWYSMYQLAVATYLQKKPSERLFLNARYTLGGVYRKEPLYYLSRMNREAGNYSACNLYSTAGLYAPPLILEEGPLFVDRRLSTWALEEEHALCLYFLGYKKEAQVWFRRILNIYSHMLSAEDRKRIEKSTTFGNE